MQCGYCDNPIGLVTGLRNRGFCSPRHQELFQMREELAGRKPESFRLQSVSPLNCGGHTLATEAPFGGRVKGPRWSPSRHSGLSSAGARMPLPCVFAGPSELRASAPAGWTVEPRTPSGKQRIPAGFRISEAPFQPTAEVLCLLPGKLLPPVTLDPKPAAPVGLAELASAAPAFRNALPSCDFRRGLPRQSLPRPLPAEPVVFRSPIRAMPALPAVRLDRGHLAVTPPAAWWPWQSWRTGDPSGWNGTAASLAPAFASAKFSDTTAIAYPRFAMPGRAPVLPASGPIGGPLEHHGQPMAPAGLVGGFLIVASPVQAPQVRIWSRGRHAAAFWPRPNQGRLAQMGGWSGPVFPIPPAIPFATRPGHNRGTDEPVRLPRAVRLGDNVVVMPPPAGPFPARPRGGAGIRAAEFQPAATALRGIDPQPERIHAVPILHLEPCAFPSPAPLAAGARA